MTSHWHGVTTVLLLTTVAACGSSVEHEGGPATAADRDDSSATGAGSGDGTGAATATSSSAGGPGGSTSSSSGGSGMYAELIDAICAGCGNDTVACVHEVRDQIVIAHDGCAQQAFDLVACYAAADPAPGCHPFYASTQVPDGCWAVRDALYECAWDRDAGCYGIGCSFDGDCPDDCSSGTWCGNRPSGLRAQCDSGICDCFVGGRLVGTCEDVDGCDPDGAEWSTLSGCCFAFFYP